MVACKYHAGGKEEYVAEGVAAVVELDMYILMPILARRGEAINLLVPDLNLPLIAEVGLKLLD